MKIEMTCYFNLSHEINSLAVGLLPVLNIPILKSLDENKITRYKLNRRTKTIETTSIIPGSVEFNLSSITGTDVNGKKDKIIDKRELGALKISTAKIIGKIKKILIIPVSC